MLQPVFEVRDLRGGLCLTNGQPYRRCRTTNSSLDGVEFGNAAQAFFRDWCGAVTGDFVQLATGMGPTVSEPNRAVCPLQQPVVARIAIDLQNAAEVMENVVGMLARTSRRIGEGNARADEPCSPSRLSPAPGSVIPCERLEIPILCSALARIEHRCLGLIHKQLGGPLQIRNQRIKDGPQLVGCLANPARRCGTVELDTVTAIYLRQASKWQMIGIFGHQYVRDGDIHDAPRLERGSPVALQEVRIQDRPTIARSRCGHCCGFPGPGNTL